MTTDAQQHLNKAKNHKQSLYYVLFTEKGQPIDQIYINEVQYSVKFSNTLMPS